MFTKHYAAILSHEFKALVRGPLLNRTNDDYCHEGKYSPIGYILWQLGVGRNDLKALSGYPITQLTGLEWMLNCKPYYFTDIEQLEFIDTEWRMHHDVGDLTRYPAMLVSGDVW